MAMTRRFFIKSSGVALASLGEGRQRANQSPEPGGWPAIGNQAQGRGAAGNRPPQAAQPIRGPGIMPVAAQGQDGPATAAQPMPLEIRNPHVSRASPASFEMPVAWPSTSPQHVNDTSAAR